VTDEEIIRPLKAIRHSSRGDRVRRRSLTMADVARETGISRETLQKIASGQLPLGPSTRAAVRSYFKCDEDHGERASVSSTTAAAFSTGSGGVYTVKWPDFGPERPPKRGLSDRRS
jgi:transcriptional regulator with XRE-family HTH domain